MLADATRQDLSNLAYLLRRPQQWPAGFRWDFRYERGCAIRLAERVGLSFADHELLDDEHYNRIFFGGAGAWYARFIGPRTIARRIEKVLAEY